MSVKRLTAAIEETLAQWVAGGLAADAAEINAGAARGGCCSDFAAAVTERLGGVTAAWEMGIQDLGIDNLLVPGECEGRPFDRELLARHWANVRPPEGLSWDDLDLLSEDAGFSCGTHVWMVCAGRHYDAETPEGVGNLFDLPFFARVVEAWVAEKRFGAHV